MTDEELIARLRKYGTGRSVIAQNCSAAADRIEALTAKLAKAVEALEFLEIAATGSGVPHPKERELLHDCIRKARATLAEIKGESKNGQ